VRGRAPATFLACLVTFTVTFAAGIARGQETPRLAARDTALGVDRYSIGVFNPLALRLNERLELRTYPLLFFVAPNAVLRVQHRIAPAGWSFTAEYGLSIPTIAMRLSQGFLFPSWDRGGGHIGWAAAPTVGVLVSRAVASPTVVTLQADVTVGIPITPTDATPLDAPAPLNLLMAPVLTGIRTRFGALVDRALSPRVRLRLYADLYVHGRTGIQVAPAALGWSNVTTRAGVGIDFAPGARRKNRVTLGVAWWNSDQHEIDEVTFARVRSNEFWPTFDFIWAD
jgi:hypothetical protein